MLIGSETRAFHCAAVPPLPDLHEAAAGQADGVHRVDPAPQPPGLRGGQLQGPFRVHRARAKREGEPLNAASSSTSKSNDFRKRTRLYVILWPELREFSARCQAEQEASNT